MRARSRPGLRSLLRSVKSSRANGKIQSRRMQRVGASPIRSNARGDNTNRSDATGDDTSRSDANRDDTSRDARRPWLLRHQVTIVGTQDWLQAHLMRKAALPERRQRRPLQTMRPQRLSAICAWASSQKAVVRGQRRVWRCCSLAKRRILLGLLIRRSREACAIWRPQRADLFICSGPMSLCSGPMSPVHPTMTGREA